MDDLETRAETGKHVVNVVFVFDITQLLTSVDSAIFTARD